MDLGTMFKSAFEVVFQFLKFEMALLVESSFHCSQKVQIWVG